MPLSNASRLADFGTGIGTAGAIIQVDNANQRLGVGTTAPTATLGVAGIVSATAFYGDGSNLDGVASAGLGTALSEVEFDPLTVIYQTSDTLSVGATITVDPPDATTKVAYTQYAEIKLEDDADLIVADGDDFIPDILGLSTEGFSFSNANGNGIFDTVYTDNIENAAGRGAPNFPLGITVTGISTLSGNVSIGGTLTYEDVTNVDSVGVVTARSGVDITGGDLNAASNLIIKVDGGEKVRLTSAGRLGVGNVSPTFKLDVVSSDTNTASFKGRIIRFDGAAATDSPRLNLSLDGTDKAQVLLHRTTDDLDITTLTASDIVLKTNSSERLRIGSAGQIGIAGANYGTSGQILTSQGNSAAPQWATPAAGGAWEWVSGYDADAAAPGATGTVNFTGLSTAYSAYKVQVSHITFYGSGASRSDNLSAKIQSNGNWLGGTDYEHKTLRYDGGGGPDGYGSNVGYLKLTANMSTEFVSGDLTIPMMTRKDASGYSTPGFYGDFQTHGNRVMFGCKITNADVRTYGFTGVQVMAESYGFYTGRIDLYRLKRS